MSSLTLPPAIGGASGGFTSSRPIPPSIEGDWGGSSYLNARPTPPPIDSYRPTPPAVNVPSYDRPTPPPVDNPSYYRPVPPPIDNPSNYRPVPPPVDPYFNDGPTPPPIDDPGYNLVMPLTPRYYPFHLSDYPSIYQAYTYMTPASNPTAIQDNFLNARQRLKDAYYSTPMTSSQYKNLENILTSQAVDELMIDASGYSLWERESALQTIYNNSPMTRSQFDRIDQDLQNQ